MFERYVEFVREARKDMPEQFRNEFDDFFESLLNMKPGSEEAEQAIKETTGETVNEPRLNSAQSEPGGSEISE